MTSAVSAYDPFLHAKNHHTLLFRHAKKFSKIRPSLIVFVAFPWFSEGVVTHLNCRDIFFRAFSRRFFCQYLKDVSPASAKLQNFVGQETVSDVTRHLSGVLFLDDKSVTASGANAAITQAHAFLNPNAHHKVSSHFRHHLESLHVFTDDFEHDNY